MDRTQSTREPEQRKSEALFNDHPKVLSYFDITSCLFLWCSGALCSIAAFRLKLSSAGDGHQCCAGFTQGFFVFRSGNAVGDDARARLNVDFSWG